MKLKNNIAISETGFVFDPNSGDSYSLNSIGKEILELIKSGKSKSDISFHILNTYDADEFTFERNYDDFIDMLKHHKLLENE
ncbi:MAG: PqqD family protein [Algibacter sp.]|uniref:PqqD family protein n=1 Tax=Algibacter sp. TaxID=1872428 RepID=UPI00261A8C3F|nr:PqqD family protein [Algibacter sp.]MDG1729689.1 PqqD family protein [Algibacter sp.]MDG2178960.1 PqqD family protein [Algibacter sp.]